jgi:ParB family chromosome partitioning protein
MWDMHDRLESYINAETCGSLIASISQSGQLVPALGRPLRGDPNYDIELIYGSRRLFAARHLKTSLVVDLRELTDRDGIIAMDIENRQRTDISPYERGIMYARWLRSGYFASQSDFAKSLKVSSAQVSRLLKLARLPAVITAAFDSPVDICETWGLEIMAVLDDPERKRKLIKRARLIGAFSPRPPAREVFRDLLATTTEGPKVRPMARDEVIKDMNGLPLFRIRHQLNSIALMLPIQVVSAKTLAIICDAVCSVLQDAKS